MSNGPSKQRRTVFIICAGHAVRKPDGDPLREEGLVLLDYQKDGKHFLLFQEHVGVSLRLLKKHLDEGSEACLIFSGGISRDDSPYSEAATYLEIAQRRAEWEPRFSGRIVLEEFARDSYENCLFGLAAGFRHSECIPDEVIIVSFAFKEQRFRYHAAALGLLEKGSLEGIPGIPSLEFAGTGNPPNLGGALVGEAKALNLFLFDPHGLSAECNQKRQERNPQGRVNDYREALAGWPLIAALLDLNRAASR